MRAWIKSQFPKLEARSPKDPSIIPRERWVSPTVLRVHGKTQSSSRPEMGRCKVGVQHLGLMTPKEPPSPTFLFKIPGKEFHL